MVLLLVAAYAALGIFFAILYVASIAPRRDPALRDSPARVRLLLVPAAAALWPFDFAQLNKAGCLGVLGLAVVVGVSVYVGAALWLRAPEVGWLKRRRPAG